MAGMKTPLAARMSAASSRLGPRLVWEARRLGRRLGWGAALGVSALALAGVAGWQTRVEIQHQRLLSAQIAEARSARPQPQADVATEAAARIAAFNAFLPAHDAIPAQLKQLVEIAARHGVTLDKADYKAQPEESADFMRYQINLPIKADYAKIQAFILGALHELPSLTLDAVLFKREQIDSADAQAQVQFKLLVKKAADKGARR